MYDQILGEILPNALMMGVEYNLFWTLNPKELSPFVKAFSLNKKYNDMIAWQQGAYFRAAIASCFDKKATYPIHPFSSTKEVTLDPKEQQLLIKQRFMNHAALLNGRFRKED